MKIFNNIYNTKHTFASLMLSNGANILKVSNTMGHINSNTTLKYYVKYIPNSIDKSSVFDKINV